MAEEQVIEEGDEQDLLEALQEIGDENPLADPVVGDPPSSPSTAAAAKDAIEEDPAPAEAEADKGTVYYVLAGDSDKGPFSLVGVFEASGQIAAKKLAVVVENDQTGKAAEKYFLAIPKSSYIPQKPSVEVTTLVTF